MAASFRQHLEATRMSAKGTMNLYRNGTPQDKKAGMLSPLATFIKSHRHLRVPATAALQLLRRIRPSKHDRLSVAINQAFRVVEGGSLIVRLPSFRGTFEICS